MISNPSPESIVIGTFAHLALPLMVMYNVLIQFVSRNVISNMHNRKSLNTLTRKIVEPPYPPFLFPPDSQLFRVHLPISLSQTNFGPPALEKWSPFSHWRKMSLVVVRVLIPITILSLSLTPSPSPTPSYILFSAVRHKRVMEFSFQVEKATWKWQKDLQSGRGLYYEQMPISG